MDTFWDYVWYTILVFAFVAYLIILFQILTDLFRDHTVSGIAKAAWVICLVIFPYITALVYLVARGKGMAERAQHAHAEAKQAADDYIRQVAGKSPAEQIADAKALLDSGTIDATEFAQLKARALGHNGSGTGNAGPGSPQGNVDQGNVDQGNVDQGSVERGNLAAR